MLYRISKFCYILGIWYAVATVVGIGMVNIILPLVGQDVIQMIADGTDSMLPTIITGVLYYILLMNSAAAILSIFAYKKLNKALLMAAAFCGFFSFNIFIFIACLIREKQMKNVHPYYYGNYDD